MVVFTTEVFKLISQSIVRWVVNFGELYQPTKDIFHVVVHFLDKQNFCIFAILRTGEIIISQYGIHWFSLVTRLNLLTYHSWQRFLNLLFYWISYLWWCRHHRLLFGSWCWLDCHRRLRFLFWLNGWWLRFRLLRFGQAYWRWLWCFQLVVGFL